MNAHEIELAEAEAKHRARSAALSAKLSATMDRGEKIGDDLLAECQEVQNDYFAIAVWRESLERLRRWTATA